MNYWLEDFKKPYWTTIDIFRVTKLVCNFRKSIEPSRIGGTKVPMDFNMIGKIFKLLMKEMEVSKWNHIMKIL